MFLDLKQVNPPLNLVYQLKEAQRNGVEDIASVQAASLNKDSRFGLKGVYGLYCSDEWWANLKNGVMPSKYVSGIIVRTYAAGMDNIGVIGDFELLLEGGSKWSESCYANDDDFSCFQVGCRVDIFYALDPLKKQPAKDGTVNYSKVVVEMAVSPKPIREY